MREQNSSKIFCIALNKMLEHLKSQDIDAKDFEKRTGLSGSTVSDLRKAKHSTTISNLEKILLDDIVSAEDLNYFIEEVKRLLNHYRNHQGQEEEPTEDNSSDLEENPSIGNVETSEGLLQASYRKGQQDFSDNVCLNYSNRCCRALSARGLRLLRIKNEEVRQNLDTVLMRISKACCEET